MGPVIVITFIAIVIGIIILGGIQAEKRRKALAAWAALHNLSFSADRNQGMDSSLGNFGSLKRGSDRYAYNLMEGEWKGRTCIAFDYHYETESRDKDGKRQTHNHYFSAVALKGPFWLNDLFIRPEGWFDKIGEFIGMDDIDFESAEFSKKFYVKSPDRKWAYDVLHQRAMQMLLDSPRFSIQFSGEWGLIWRDSVFKVEEFEPAADTLGNLFEMFPGYLLQQHGSQREAN